MKKIIVSWVILVIVLTIPAFSFAKGDPNPSTLKVALLPDEDGATVIKNNQGFKDYLEKRLGRKIELHVTTDYSSMIEAIRHGRIDLAYFGPLSYVMAKSKSDIEAFAAKAKRGSATYHGVIIANTSSGISSIKDIRTKNMAFGDPASTSSHMIPKAMLKDSGLKAGIDYKEHFLGAHDAVAVTVQSGRADAGGLSKPIFESLVKRGLIDPNKVKVVSVSKPFPQYPWAMRSDIDQGLKEEIKKVFYALKDKDILKQFKADGLVPISDKDYNVVRDLKKTLGL